MLYEVMKCVFISFLPHPGNNTSIIENMWRNQQGELVFKSTQNGWINMWLKILTVLTFKRRIDMGNYMQNFIGCQGSSRYSDISLCKIQNPQDPTITCTSWIQDPQDRTKSSIRDPRSPGSQGNFAVTGSKISKIPRENENTRYKILHDFGSWILEIQDPGSFGDLGTCLPRT